MNEILENIENYSAPQLFDFIKSGELTMQQMMATGKLLVEIREEIEFLIKNNGKEEEGNWESVKDSNNIKDLEEYLRQYPTGKYSTIATEKINNLKSQKEQNDWNEIKHSKKKQDFIDFIDKYPEGKFAGQVQARINYFGKNKHNILSRIEANDKELSAGEIREILLNNDISIQDLINRGVNEEVAQFIQDNNVDPIAMDLGEIPDYVPDGYTEVYLWGMPGSGKTVALSGILTSATRKGIIDTKPGPGYDFMSKLQNLFLNKYSVLPEPTSTDKLQYLPFQLFADKNNRPRNIALIELSGEAYEGFDKKLRGIDNIHSSFYKLLELLKSNNRKIHFFFIDYGAGNKILAGKNVTQSQLFESAMKYIDNEKIFTQSTNGIYVVLTKSDLMDVPESEWDSSAIDYLKNDGYLNGMNNLKRICEKRDINNKKLLIEPFSTGEIYFRHIAKFNETYTNRIVDILIEKTIPQKSRWLNFLTKRGKKQK